MFQERKTAGSRTLAYCPINVDLEGKCCLVVGGGEVGRRKIQGLLEYGARVHLVDRELDPDLAELLAEGKVIYMGREFKAEHLDDAVLVYAATDDSELNSRIARQAAHRGIWVNVVDRPDLCSFIVPASVRRGDLVISVSTSGSSPALARRIRRRLEAEYGLEYESYLVLMGLIRKKVLAQGRPARENAELFRRLVDSDLFRLMAKNDYKRVDTLLAGLLGPEFRLSSLEFQVPREDGA